VNERLIVSTEPEPLPDVLPDDAPCPRCRAGADRRVLSGGFGDPWPICGKCGYDLRVRSTDGDR
jgi:uncharacterized protein (DUF983 family)